TSPRWERFLGELWPDDPDSAAALQQFTGYLLSGRTDLHKILLIIGPTRAGKGTIARIIAMLLGASNVAGPTLASLSSNFGLAPLVGKPLAIVSDARLSGNSAQVVERLLSISGEDALTIDRKFREPWTGKLPTRFMVMSNELPSFGDASGAIARRFAVLMLSHSWLGAENTSLTAELATELPGILNWGLDGLAALADAGRLTEPKSSDDAMVALLDQASPVSAFVRDRCETGVYEVPVDDLYAEWKAWCDDNGRDKPGSKQIFGRNLSAVVPGLRRSQPRAEQPGTDHPARTRIYVGIRLKENGYAHSGFDRVPSRATATCVAAECGEPMTIITPGQTHHPLCGPGETR
ncbi:MAG TPA: phage/plasmid primase, P4 family, partial [Streptosporangiaceae bacterium]